jgi:flavin-dependent dehydrogenase
LIIGDGPAGCSLAISLKRLGLSVVVLSRATPPRPLIQSVSPRIAQPLAHLELWDRFQQAGFLPSEGISSAWGTVQTSETDYYFQPPGIGWHIDRAKFDRLLQKKAVDLACQFVSCGRLLSVRRQPDQRGWQVVGSPPANRHRSQPVLEFEICCRLLVDATGRKSATARYVGARRIVVDRQVALVAPCQRQPPDAAGRLRLESTSSGWWYYAPTRTGCSSVVFVTDFDLFPRRADSRGAFLAARWNESQVVRPFLNGMPRFDVARVLPAETSFLDDNFKTGWMAIGDAALTVDPLSGEGVIRSLDQGIEAAALIANSLEDDNSGVGGPRASFRASVAGYLRARRSVFSMETRWPKSSYWRRRQMA